MKPGKIIFYTIAALVVAGGAIVVYRKFTGVKSAEDLAKELEAKAPNSPEAIDARNTANLAVTTPSGFPLRRGSNSNLVKQMQQGLMRLHGNVLPRYGADGIFGSETEGALTNNGHPKVVDQTEFNKIVYPQGVPASYIPGSGQAVPGSSGQVPMANAGAGVNVTQPFKWY